MSATLRQHFDSDLSALQLEVLRMGTYVVEMLDLATKALLEQNTELAGRVVDMDDLADTMDLQIEQSCLRLLALQQPMSRDLRTISSALKIITDLERIGDFSVDIAKTARRMANENYLRPMVPISGMAAAVKALVREALQAYVDHDLDRVHHAIRMDDEVDDYYDRIFTELMQHVERDPSLYRQAIWFSHVLHFLERMADHAVNVAERVSYMVTGEFTDFAHHRQVRSVHRPSSA
jgi:phosphate transport system protein